MHQDEAVRGFATTLCDVARDPAKVGELHGLLGEFCHLVRNRLNSLKISLYLASRARTAGPAADWAGIDREYRALESFVEQFQAVCRPMRPTPVRLELGRFLAEKAEHWRPKLEAEGRRVELLPPADPAVGVFDPYLLGLALDALASWRAAAGRPDDPIRLSWGDSGGLLHVEWHERHESPDAEDAGRGSPHLALPLLARVLEAHRGRLHPVRGPGCRIRLGWPAATLDPGQDDPAARDNPLPDLTGRLTPLYDAQDVRGVAQPG